MRHSIEARAPFLSHKLIESMRDLPTSIKNPRQTWFKGLLREWATGILPSPILSARKRGFALPRDWSVVPKDERGMNSLDQSTCRIRLTRRLAGLAPEESCPLEGAAGRTRAGSRNAPVGPFPPKLAATQVRNRLK
jgi:hypothetical protein